ncbi:MAG: hypothetical protein AAGD13_22645 [Pseudomonadota bacterium]
MFADRENKSRVNAELLQLIELGLALNGKFSARSASIAVVGHDGLVRDIRQKGNVPTADKVDALFRLLGISYNLGTSSPSNETLPIPRAQNGGRSAVQLISVGGDSPRLIGTVPSGPFTLQVRFDICDRLKEGWYGFVDPFQKPENRDIVFLQDRSGTPQVAIFHSGAASDPRHVAIESLTGERHGIEFVSVTSYSVFAPITWTGRVSPDIHRSYDAGYEGKRSRFSQLKGLIDEIRDDAAVEEVDLSHIELVEKAIQLLKNH